MNKNYLLTPLIMFAALAPTHADAAPVEYGNRPFYGFFLTNGDYSNAEYGQYGFARQTFDRLWANELIKPLTGNQGVYAAAAIDGIYYFAPYQFVSSLQAPSPLPLMKYNIYSGNIEEIGPWNDGDANFKLWDMTYDIKNDRLLAIGNSPETGMRIYEVDRNTGKLTLLRPLNPGGGVLACDAFGRVFTITMEGELYEVDMTSQTRQIKLCNLDYSMLYAHQSLEFDHTSNKLYWASNCYENPNHQGVSETLLVEIEMPNIGPDANYTPGSYKQNEVDAIGSNSTFLGMYIPYCTGGFKAPGMATDIRTESAPDGKSCKITFKTPVTTFGGEELASLDGYDIFRDGVRISSEKNVEMGKEYSFNDTEVPESGEYRYDVVCYSNVNGDGPKSPAFAYVGFDKPCAVSNIAVKIAPDFLKADLTWNAPAAGALGGTYIHENTTYDILRLPDNVEVAKDLKEPRFTDTLRRLLRYSYRITAKNEYGQSVSVSKEFVAGTPVSEFPVEEGFDNPTAAMLRWQIVDNNNDSQTWIFDPDFGHGVFGDYEMTADYILSPTTVESNVADADDWLISPPLKFGDDNYSIELKIRSLTPEHFTIYTGDMNSTESLTTEAGSFSLNSPLYEENGTMSFQSYVVKLPETLRNTTGCVGIKLDTPLPADNFGYVQVANILIDSSKNISAVENAVADNFSVSFSNSEVTVSGNYTSGTIYNAGGVMVRTLTGAVTDISDLPAGIYLLTVDNRSYKIVR